MNCYFRTNVTKKTGIGNYKRCLRLALSLREKGHNCTIFTDHKLNKYFFNKKIKHEYLFKNNYRNFSNLKDSEKFLSETKKPGYILVDDNRIDLSWQKKVKDFHKKLIIISDYSKKNVADILINTKPDYLISSNCQKEVSKNKNKKLLLGPSYSIIEKKIKSKNKKDNTFKIMFYFGGSGNLKYATNIIKEFITSKKLLKYKIFVIVGPNSKNFKDLLSLQKKYFTKIKLIFSPKNLSNLLASLNLYIGSAGISIFETSLYKIPSLLFKTSHDQEVDASCLEKLGHYFLMEKNDLKETKKICEIISIFFKERSRIKNLVNSRKFNVDDRGTNRIVREIFKNDNFYIKYYEKKVIKKSLKKSNFTVEKIDDVSINKYLDISNKSINRNNSLRNKKIKKIDHYIWWFKNRRASFIFKKNNEKIILFFHNTINMGNDKFIVPGWYIIKKDASFLDIIMGLKKQYNILSTLKNKEKITQLGVINKNNKSMIKFAPKLHWKKLKSTDFLFSRLNKKIKSDNFLFYTR